MYGSGEGHSNLEASMHKSLTGHRDPDGEGNGEEKRRDRKRTVKLSSCGRRRRGGVLSSKD